MRFGLLEGILIIFVALFIFGTKRLGKIRSSFKEAVDEFKDSIEEE